MSADDPTPAARARALCDEIVGSGALGARAESLIAAEIAAAVAVEREACAAAVEATEVVECATTTNDEGEDAYEDNAALTLMNAARRIRARGAGGSDA